MKGRVKRLFFALPFFCFFWLAAAVAAENPSVTVKNNSLVPSSEVAVRKGEPVTFAGTDVPLTVTLENAQGRAKVPAAAAPKTKGRDIVFSLKAGIKIAVLFLEPGDYRFSIEGLNPGQQARKCGVDVLPHSVEGVLRVRE